MVHWAVKTDEELDMLCLRMMLLQVPKVPGFYLNPWNNFFPKPSNLKWESLPKSCEQAFFFQIPAGICVANGDGILQCQHARGAWGQANEKNG